MQLFSGMRQELFETWTGVRHGQGRSRAVCGAPSPALTPFKRCCGETQAQRWPENSLTRELSILIFQVVSRDNWLKKFMAVGDPGNAEQILATPLLTGHSTSGPRDERETECSRQQ